MIRRELIKREKFYKLLNFTPTDAQKDPIYSKAKIRICNGGRRSGKTLIWCIEDARLLMSGPYSLWIVGPTYELASRAFRLLEQLLWHSSNEYIRSYMKPVKFINGYKKYIKFANGAELWMLSGEEPDKSLLGAGVDRLHITEAARFAEEVFSQYLLPCVSDTDGYILIDSTPWGDNWYKRLHDQGTLKINNIEAWTLPTWTNTVQFPLGENDPKVIQLKNLMSDTRYRQEVKGEFTTFEGRIIPEFTKEFHVVDEYIYKRGDIHYGGIDWGTTHPAALIVASYNEKTEEGIVIDEYIASGLKTEDLLNEAIRLNKKHNIKTWFAGNDRPENKILFNEHVNCVGAEDGHQLGVDILRSMATIRETEYLLKKYTRFYITKNCEKTIDSFMNAHYKKDRKGNSTGNFHDDRLDPLDGTRYIFASVGKEFDMDKLEGNLEYVLGEG